LKKITFVLALVLLFVGSVASIDPASESNLYYSFDSDNVTGTSDGDTIYDVSPNSNFSTINGGASSVSGALSSPSSSEAFKFASSEYAVINSSFNSFNARKINDFSISFWIKTTEGSDVGIMGTRSGGPSEGLRIFSGVRGSNGGVELGIIDSNSNEQSIETSNGNLIDDGNWHHVVFVKDSNTDIGNIYIDGSTVSTSNSANDDISSVDSEFFYDFYIGAINSAASVDRDLDGSLDEFAVFTKALSSSEVDSLYQGDYLSSDSTVPTVTIDSPQNQTYSTDTVDLNVSASESISTWEYSLDGGSNTSFTPNTTISGLSDGSYSLDVYATDSDGNTGSNSVSFTVDTTINTNEYDESISTLNTPVNDLVFPFVDEDADGDGQNSTYYGQNGEFLFNDDSDFQFNRSGNQVFGSSTIVDQSKNQQVTGSPPSGLEAYFPLDNDDASDITGQISDGTIESGVETGLDGKVKKSFNFTKENVDLGSNIHDFSGTSDFSVSVWFKTSNDINDESYAGSFLANSGADEGFYISQDTTGQGVDNNLLFKIDDGTNDAFFNSDNAINDGEWHHTVIAVDASGGTFSAYLDGEKVDSVSQSVGNMRDKVALGQALSGGSFDDSSTSANYFSGRLDDLRFYSRTLDLTDVKGIYNSTKPVSGYDPSFKTASLQVSSPKNTTYRNSVVNISGTTSESAEVLWNIDGSTNKTACSSCTSFNNETSSLSEGGHTANIYASFGGTTYSESVDFKVNTTPVVDSVSISPDYPSPSDGLQCQASISGEVSNAFYEWFVDGEKVSSSQTLSSSETSNKDLAYCKVTVNDGTSNTSSKESSAKFILETSDRDRLNFTQDNSNYTETLASASEYVDFVWDNYRDDNTNLIVQDTTNDVYDPEDAGADNLGYQTQAVRWLDDTNKQNWYNDSIPSEISNTLCQGNLSGDYDTGSDSLDCSFSDNQFTFKNTERARDGILPLIDTYPGTDQYRNRVYDILTSVPDYSTSTEYGDIPSEDSETVGNTLQSASRLYFYYDETGQTQKKQEMYDIVKDINEGYHYEVLPSSSCHVPARNWDWSSSSATDTEIGLGAHAVEIFSGLVWGYKVEKAESTNQTRINDFNQSVDHMIGNTSDIAQKDSGNVGQFVDKIDSSSCSVVDSSFDKHQYFSEALGAYVQMYNNSDDRQHLEKWQDNAHTWDYSSLIDQSRQAENVADFAEITMNHYSRMDLNRTQLDHLSTLQDRIIERQQSNGNFQTDWYGNGNALRSLILYSQMVSNGVHESSYTGSVDITGRDLDQNAMAVTLSSSSSLSGKAEFSEPRYDDLGLSKNFIRHNEMIQGYPVESGNTYTVKNREEKTVQNYTGSELQSGLSFDLASSESMLVQDVSADDTAPSITVSSPNDGTTYSSSEVDLNVTSNEPVETWQYSLDGGSNQTFTPNITLTGLTEGSHNLNVYATDSEGNTGEASASFVVDINEAPTASFSFSPSDPVVDETISFDASGSSDSDGSIVSYEWDWTNDGTFEDSGQTASHSYGSSSNFNAVLRVTDDEGATDTVSNVVEVGSGSVDNPAPEVNLSLNATDIVVGDSVLANVSASDDGNISILELDWEGDGVYDESGFVNEFNATNTYNESGIYSVTARAEDDEGKETLESVTVNVDNVRTSTNKSIISSCENSTSSDGFCLENRTDETSIQGFTNDDSYTFEASVDVINSIVGEFTLFGFVNTTSGRNDGVESGKVNVSVNDESSVVNDPPTAEYSISPADPTPGETISFDGSLSSDPDGSIVSYEWDWTNDGTIDDTGVNPSHSYGSEGDYTARLVVTDDEGATSTYTNTVPVQSESSDGGGGGGDDGSDDGGGSIGDPDDGDSTNEASADGSSVNLISPKSQTKFVGSSIALDESASDDTTVTIGGNDNTFKLVEIIDGNTAKIDVSGQNYTLDIGEELPLNFGVNDASRVYLSSVTDTEDVGEVSLNIYGTGFFADDTASPYYSYNYSLDGAADVSLLIKNTEDSSFTEVDSFSSNSAVNGTQTFVGNESSGIYEAKLELNTENSTVETDKVGFYLGKVPVINILRPSNGVTIERPAAQGNISAPLDFEFRLANNVSSNISTYYESVDTGQRFDGNIESVDVRNREDGILETFVRKGLNLAFSWTDKIQFGPDVDVQGNSSVYISEKGEFDGFVNVSVFGEDNSLSARSVPISVDVVGLDLSNESERRDYFDSRDGDSEQSFVESPSVNKSVGDNSSVRYFDSRFAVFEPDPGTRFEVRDLENFDLGIDFDFVVNASDSSQVNRSLFVESVNGSTVVERELNPLQAQHFETLDETDFNGSWSEGRYRVYGKTFYENGSVLQTVDPDHSFYVEDATPGLIQYTFGSVVEALTTVYDFTSERAGLLIALFGVGGWYAGFKSRNYDFLARWGAVGLIAFFSGWIPGGPVYIPGSIQAVVLTVGAATLTLKFLRGDITL
jgi:hypothetical protein